MLDTFLSYALNPFLDWVVLAWMIGQFMKAYVWTKSRATAPSRLQAFWKWGYRTRAFHPVATGAMIGWLWSGEIAPGYTGGTWLGAWYFAGAGMMACWGYDLIKGLFKPLGVEIPDHLPGISSLPPPPSYKPPPPPAPSVPMGSFDPEERPTNPEIKKP